MNEVTMTLAASATLTSIINYILVDEEGKERDLTFDVKYKLLRNKNALAEDVFNFNEKRVEIIKEIGVENPETKTTTVPEDKLEEFKDRMIEYASTQVTRSLVKISIEDVSTLKMPSISSTEMDLFMATMVDDPLFNEESEVKADTKVELDEE